MWNKNINVIPDLIYMYMQYFPWQISLLVPWNCFLYIYLLSYGNMATIFWDLCHSKTIHWFRWSQRKTLFRVVCTNILCNSNTKYKYDNESRNSPNLLRFIVFTIVSPHVHRGSQHRLHYLHMVKSNYNLSLSWGDSVRSYQSINVTVLIGNSIF